MGRRHCPLGGYSTPNDSSVKWASAPGAYVHCDPPSALPSQVMRGRILARWRTEGGAKPVRLCPCSSDVNLFSYCEGISNFDAEIPDGAIDLRMSQQQLLRHVSCRFDGR